MFEIILVHFLAYLKVSWCLVVENHYRSHLRQGLATSVLEGRCPAEFSSNPYQTHLKKLINVFKITKVTGRCDWLGLELNSTWHYERTEVAYPCLRTSLTIRPGKNIPSYPPPWRHCVPCIIRLSSVAVSYRLAHCLLNPESLISGVSLPLDSSCRRLQ